MLNAPAATKWRWPRDFGRRQKEYTYPPLWGANSYNSGAGLYRISRFAGYKINMPLGATYENPLLTDEESLGILRSLCE
jgi:cytochrome c